MAEADRGVGTVSARGREVTLTGEDALGGSTGVPARLRPSLEDFFVGMMISLGLRFETIDAVCVWTIVTDRFLCRAFESDRLFGGTFGRASSLDSGIIGE